MKKTLLLNNAWLLPNNSKSQKSYTLIGVPSGMKIKLSLLFVYLTFIVRAQVVFCPAGAEWHYTFRNAFDPIVTNETIAYTHDSILGSDTVKVLTHRYFFASGNDTYYAPTLLKQSGDTVFMRNSLTQHHWEILYNFNVLAGQQWTCTVLTEVTTPPSNPVSYTVSVISTGSIIANGVNLKQLHVNYYAGNATQPYSSTTITERFGNDNYLFNFYSHAISDYDFLGEFLCYKDDSFGTKQFTSKSCNYANLTGVKDYERETAVFAISPNPFPGKLNLTCKINPSERMKLDIFNTSGNRVYTQNGIDANQELDLSDLPAGIYFLKMQSTSQQSSMKVIRE